MFRLKDHIEKRVIFSPVIGEDAVFFFKLLKERSARERHEDR